MGTFEAFLYGAVQGFTEYLPISSSAHLLILPHFLGQNDPGLAFDVFLHIGTLLATGLYFFKDWMQILKTPFPKALDQSQQGRSGLSIIHLIVGTLPAVMVGFLLNHWIQENTRSLVILWFTLPIFGIFLWLADRYSKNDRPITQASYRDMLMIGCAQALALIPGVSRSGSTLTASRLLGFSRADSARISFLLSMPITLGAIVFELRHFEQIKESANGLPILLISAGSAMVFGLMAIRVMLTWVSRTSFSIFAFYRIALAVIIALLF